MRMDFRIKSGNKTIGDLHGASADANLAENPNIIKKQLINQEDRNRLSFIRPAQCEMKSNFLFLWAPFHLHFPLWSNFRLKVKYQTKHTLVTDE